MGRDTCKRQLVLQLCLARLPFNDISLRCTQVSQALYRCGENGSHLRKPSRYYYQINTCLFTAALKSKSVILWSLVSMSSMSGTCKDAHDDNVRCSSNSHQEASPTAMVQH